ncbi:MAG: methyltransferase domain-containing protein [Marivita sp.]|uniref:class I SAM-dependent DNA methyltransferase n=1 Tax=Marivita sp. TaxID=2003365 RepID=UPI003EF9A058
MIGVFLILETLIMSKAPHLTGTSSQTSPASAPSRPMALLAPDVSRALALFEADKRSDALALSLQIVEQGRMGLPDACVLSVLMRKLDQAQTADALWANVADGLGQITEAGEGSVTAMLDTAHILADLEALDEVETLCRRAHEVAPNDEKTLNRLLAILTHRDNLPEAQAVAEAFCERNGDRFEILLYLATIFSHFDAKPAVVRFLDMARTRCKTKTQRAKLNYLLAANGMPVSDLDQHGMAVEIFDNFAESYDDKLELLGNRGPDLIFAALQEMDLPKSKKRRVLDAGCGTGLCAGFLRMYAKEIIGVDISVKMLEKSRAKGGYDFLARTDLSEIGTYPEGRFDMIVCADVLVYFGALKTVFSNFHSVLSPGGWLLVTVEDEEDPAVQSGFRLHKSGRYKHAQGYLLSTLAQVGFPKPKLLKQARLRNEMSKPIMGTVFAVQKSALSFG